MHATSSLLNGARPMAPPLQTVGAEADDEENRIAKKETPHAKKNSVSVNNPVTADRATRRQEGKNAQPEGAAASSSSKDCQLEQAIVNDENISKMAPSMVAGTGPAEEQNNPVKEEEATGEERKDDGDDGDAKSGFSRVKSILSDLKNTKAIGEEVDASKSAISRDPMFIKVEERLS